MKKRSILIVDDEPAVIGMLTRFTSDLGHSVFTAGTCREVRDLLPKTPVDLILLDVGLPDGQGVDLFREVQKSLPDLPVIFLTGEGRVEDAVEAMRLGARDFLLKPFNLDVLSRSIASCLQPARPVASSSVPGLRPVVGQSSSLREVWRQIDLFAPTDITILLLGDSGTGKELFARAIHGASKRAAGPFIELDCASIPSSLIESELFGYDKGAFTDAKENRPGKFELASGGTLFLDELGNLTLEVQAKLLRLVQERRFRRIGGQVVVNADVRIVGATNLDLEEAVRRGAFRGDLYYRLSEMPIRLPALCERDGDIPLLVDAFVMEFNACYNKSVTGLTPAALRILSAFAWPGNVRELANVIRIGVLQCERVIDIQDLPKYIVLAVQGAENGHAHSRPSLFHSQGASSFPASPHDAETPRQGPAVSEHLDMEIPWPSEDAGLDLKEFTHGVKSKVEGRILRRLVEDLRMNKAQIARYLKVDYKVVAEKLRTHGLG